MNNDNITDITPHILIKNMEQHVQKLLLTMNPTILNLRQHNIGWPKPEDYFYEYGYKVQSPPLHIPAYVPTYVPNNMPEYLRESLRRVPDSILAQLSTEAKHALASVINDARITQQEIDRLHDTRPHAQRHRRKNAKRMPRALRERRG